MMSKNTSITLGDHFTDFIDQQITAGRFGSASEVVRAGLRLLEEREAKLKALQAALVEGEQSGEVTDFSFDTFVTRKHKASK
jgi:antitoxin ParD1/3/4